MAFLSSRQWMAFKSNVCTTHRLKWSVFPVLHTINSMNSGGPSVMGTRTGQKYAAAVAVAAYANYAEPENSLRKPFVLISFFWSAACPALALYAVNSCFAVRADCTAITVVVAHPACSPFAVVAKYFPCCLHSVLPLRNLRECPAFAA